MLLNLGIARRPIGIGSRTSLLFKVYPAEPDAGDASEIGGKLRTHGYKLTKPFRACNADVQHVFRIEVKDFSATGERRAAGHRPCGGEAVFWLEIAETARE